jgi:uncharacterized membrane protein YqaE (UPF0057 family)
MGWNTIVDIFLSVGQMAKNILAFIENAIKIVTKIVTKLVEFFFIILEPTKLLKDIFYGITVGLKTIIYAILDIFFGKLTLLFNIHTDNSTSNNGKLKSSKSAVCAKPNLLTFILLVLCPPLAVFTQQGLKGLFHVIITSFLTCIYYFPGLIYASLILL